MSIFLGLIVLEQIPRDRYASVLVELEQILQVHHKDITNVSDASCIKFKISQIVFWLPRNPQTLNTIYYRVFGEGDLQLAIELIWECLCVVKENFPSKVELYQENLDEFNIFDWEAELLRRQLNTLQNRALSGVELKKDELEDVFAILHLSQKQKNQRGIEVCLTIMNSELIQPLHLNSLSEKYIDQLEALGQKSIALNIMRKINRRSLVNEVQETLRPSQNDKELIREIRQNPKYDMNHSSQSIIFQLRESKEMARVCFYLDYILQKQVNLITSIPGVVVLIVDKYYEGQYTRSDLSDYCVFHTLLCQAHILLLKQRYQFEQHKFQQFLSVMEEGVLNWLTNLINMDCKLIYSEFPHALTNLYSINSIFSSQIRSHKNSLLSLIINKLGLIANNKSDQQLIYENIEEMKCISRPLVEFVEKIV